ncbi:DUF7736 domain-containing protein [Henriciella aquimarina]|uniref:DUF7736 domain-containing protein n=1 Tax=Henriciella aquimarina TaxID=545261 RepID=UPI000A01B6BE|nr:hypothetical protein [Henriciella aquimarina]
MAETKEFPTLQIASAITGIGLCEGMKYSDMQVAFDHILGRPVWTHELGHGATTEKVRELGFAQFPDMPAREEAQADWKAAAAKALAAYGETVTVRRGQDVREADPISTAIEMRSGGQS